MLLTPWEDERLLIFTAAELARRHRAAGLRLNAPETVALVCDAMLEAARAGRTYAEVEDAGRAAVEIGDVMPGVRELVGEIRLEVLLDDGVRLIVLVDPLGGPGHAPAAEPGPGAIRPALEEPADATADLERRTLLVENTSRRAVRISSHFPFDRVNARLRFDRGEAAGFRLDLPAGSSERWAAGESKTVTLVRYRGPAGQPPAGRAPAGRAPAARRKKPS